jgi:hypothetical protein
VIGFTYEITREQSGEKENIDENQREAEKSMGMSKSGAADRTVFRKMILLGYGWPE